jgi:hypothetical protein
MSDDLTANQKYYGSAQRSVIAPGPDRHGRPGQPQRIMPAYLPSPDDTSSDKYYANNGSSAQRHAAMLAQQPATQSIVRPAAGGAYGTKHEGDLARPLQVASVAEVPAAADKISQLIAAGQSYVFVEVAPAAWNALIVQFDVQMSRGRLSASDISVRIKLRKLAASGAELAEQMFGKIDPSAVPLAGNISEPANTIEAEEFERFVNEPEPEPDEKSLVTVETQEAPEIAMPAMVDDTD